MSNKSFSEILQRALLQKPLGKISVKKPGIQFSLEHILKEICGKFWLQRSCSLYNTDLQFSKQTRSQKLFGKFSKLSQSIILHNTSICVEESNHVKDHMSVRREAPSFCTNKKIKHRTLTLNILELGRTLVMKCLLTHF